MIDARPVGDDQWPIVEWLWQAYRNDLAPIVHGFPRADGRYNRAPLDAYPGADDRAGFLVWQPHPGDGVASPVAFALVDGIGGEVRSVAAFFVLPAARRGGLGHRLALDVLARYPKPWTIGFQQDNVAAGQFWRSIARAAFGEDWREDVRPVPGKPDVPPDHWISAS